MTLSDIFTYVTKVGIDITITTKARVGDQFYVSAYRPTMNSHARKAFSTEAEMEAAIKQCLAELFDEPHPVDVLRACAEQVAEASGLEVDHAAFDAAKQEYENLDDFTDTVDILAHEFG